MQSEFGSRKREFLPQCKCNKSSRINSLISLPTFKALAALLILTILNQIPSSFASAWTPVGDLDTERRFHTATLLFNGAVLVAGGENSGGRLASVERYNPSYGSWIDIEELATARFYHTATLLADGRVLVVGGRKGGGLLDSAELYDPSTGSWSTTGSLNT